MIGKVVDLAVGDADEPLLYYRGALPAAAERDPRPVLVRLAPQVPEHVRTLKDQVRVVLPGDRDPAVELDHLAGEVIERLRVCSTPPRRPPARARRQHRRPGRRPRAALRTGRARAAPACRPSGASTPGTSRSADRRSWHELQAVGDRVVEGALHAADLEGGGQDERDVADVVGEWFDAAPEGRQLAGGIHRGHRVGRSGTWVRCPSTYARTICA